ncbi:MAG: hypothetical protein ABIK48_08525 [candidate division WOR-3 bacterium]
MHYYLYEFGTAEGDTGACIVEIYSDSAQSPGPEFTKVTLDQLHSLGYLTYQEQVALTPHYNIDLVSYVNGFIAASWAETIPPPPNRPQTKKYTWCGSKTLRPYSGPWYLYCRYEKDGHLVPEHPYEGGSRDSIGYIAGWTLGCARTIRGQPNVKFHEVWGEHSFTYPPEAIIRTHAQLLDGRGD